MKTLTRKFHIKLSERDGAFVYLKEPDVLLTGGQKENHFRLIDKYGYLERIIDNSSGSTIFKDKFETYSMGYVKDGIAYLDTGITTCDVELAKNKLIESGKFKDVEVVE